MEDAEAQLSVLMSEAERAIVVDFESGEFRSNGKLWVAAPLLVWTRVRIGILAEEQTLTFSSVGEAQKWFEKGKKESVPPGFIQASVLAHVNNDMQSGRILSFCILVANQGVVFEKEFAS